MTSIKDFIISTLSNFSTSLSKNYQKRSGYSYQSGFVAGPNWYHVAYAPGGNLVLLPVIFSCTAGWYNSRPATFIAVIDALHKTVGQVTLLHNYVYNTSDVPITQCRLSHDATAQKFYIDIYIETSKENKFHYKIDDNRSWTIMPLTAVTEDETLTTVNSVSLI